MNRPPRNPWPRPGANVVPFRRARRWTRARDYGVQYGAKPDRRWIAMMITLPLAAFGAVFLSGGPPPADALPSAPQQTLLPRGWDADPAAIDAAQPTVAGSAAGSTGAAGTPVSARFGLCNGRGGGGGNCVIDGDTFWYQGEKVRIADINTPETGNPGCPSEAALGARATTRLHALLNEGAFELHRVDRDRDQYGRLLRTVTRDGASLGETLVAEGLAEEWQGFRRDWC